MDVIQMDHAQWESRQEGNLRYEGTVMENKDCLGSTYRDYPSLLRYITSKAISGFDTSLSPRSLAMFIEKSEESRINGTSKMSSPNSPVEAIESRMPHNISISLPASPCGLNKEHSQRVRFSDCAAENVTNNQSPASSLHQPKVAEYHSQPILAGRLYANSSAGELSDHLLNMPQRNLRNQRLKDKRFDSFKTLSGKLERQISSLRGKPQQPEAVRRSQITEPEAVPAVHRYFDALEGPELETLKSSEELVLPHDKKWPFLLRFPVSSFGICLGVSSQAILWKTLATSPSTSFLHVSATVNLILWCISLVLMGIVTIIYALKLIFYFEAVRREYYHPIRVNFFFAPWIACLFLALGAPPTVANKMHAPLWYVLMAPILCLELKIYGQWMSGGQRRLSKVANPSNHLSVVGNFVGALLGASMGLKEGPIFFFAVGLAHYIVLFVTLYQRLPTNETLPKELHPVFFLFVAAPSVACMAWAKIMGDFDNVSRMAYFIALFLYGSLAVRINFFRGFRFSLAWWAYTFPMTGASIATIKYSTEVKNLLTQCLSVALSAISSLAVSALLVSTIVHAFVLRDLFPNDISIAITERKKSNTKHSHTKSASSNEKDLEACNSL